MGRGSVEGKEKEKGRTYSIATCRYNLHVATLGVARVRDGAAPFAQSDG